MQAKGLKEPAACVPWTDEEERMLLNASKENIELGDTALGRRSMILNATTNQKLAAATEGSMEGR